MNKSIQEQLKILQKLYQKEADSKRAIYEAEIKKLEQATRDAESFDYTREYTSKYEASLSSLEKIYENIATTHSITNGLSFRVNDYIKTLLPRRIEYGQVEEHLGRLVKECKEAICAVSQNDTTPEDDIEPLKRFCQGLVDLRYIVENGTELILQSGIPASLKSSALEMLKTELVSCHNKHQEALKLESFDCYAEIKSFKDMVIANKNAIRKKMLGSSSISSSCDNKFLMGFYSVEIDKKSRDFAKDILGLSDDDLSNEPIYFNLGSNHSTILIKAKKHFFKTYEFDDLMNNIYFSFVSSMPAKELLFSGVEAGTNEAVLGGLHLQIQKSLNEALFGNIATDLDGTNEIFSLLKSIDKLTMERSKIYRSNYVHDIFSYNASSSESRDKFILFTVNHYPCGFNTGRDNGYMALKELATEAGSKGIITVICEAIDESFDAYTPILSAEELNADCIEITDKGVYYNEREANLNIRAPEFDLKTYWGNLKTYFDQASSLWLSDVLEKSKEHEKENPLPPFYKEIRIPIGSAGGELFELSMKSCSAECFALVVGTIGSGKSSFLHTLILSAASRYSPDELRFCLVDFKSEKDSPEFSQYRKHSEHKNLYIPHVDYLMVNGKSECVFDLFGKIEAMKRERSEILSKYNYTEVSVYNAGPEVASGRAPKLPQVFFIIDEYNIMLSGGVNDVGLTRAKIISGLDAVIKAVRSYGIGIILCGQSVADHIVGNALDQMYTRISLRNESESDYSLLMHMDTRSAREDLSYLTSIGYSIFSTNAGKTRAKVRLAYSGTTGCDGQLLLAEEIRSRYDDNIQIEAGSEDKYPISDANGLVDFKVIPPAEADKAFHLPIGVASASMLRVALEYSYRNDSMNYFAFASEGQLFDIERNAMFAFLDKVNSNTSKIKYLGIQSVADKCLKDYIEAYPFLKEKVSTRTTRKDMAREILSLSDLFDERKRIAETSNVNFDPVFVVIHDIEWLRDSDTSWLVDNNSTSNEESSAKAITIEGKSIGSLAARMLAGKAKANQTQTSSEHATAQQAPAKRFLTAYDYCELLGKLYEQGNRYGIFMLISSQKFSPIEKILLSCTGERNLAIEKYSIYGSAVEKENQIRDEFSARDCAYACPSCTKTRLFDYSPRNNASWWSSLEIKLKGDK